MLDGSKELGRKMSGPTSVAAQAPSLSGPAKLVCGLFGVSKHVCVCVCVWGLELVCSGFQVVLLSVGRISQKLPLASMAHE